MIQTRFRFAARRAIAALVPLALVAAAEPPPANPSPGEIAEAAPPAHWVAMAPADLLVMDLAPDAAGKARRVVIQLISVPFSTGWVGNIRTLAAAHWWDGLAIVRVQDNYVVQWGDPDGEDEAKARPLPKGIITVPESAYVAPTGVIISHEQPAPPPPVVHKPRGDAYAEFTDFRGGWPVGRDHEKEWPVHCYGMVGVGRNLSPDTGSGAELYAVIGHAPRHLDRNIALVGRVVEGIEHLSSLPRGTGPLGFYENPEDRTVIRSVRLASDLPPGEQPRLEYLDTASASFARYAEARANRKDAFFNLPAGGADICNIPVPIRKARP